MRLCARAAIAAVVVVMLAGSAGAQGIWYENDSVHVRLTLDIIQYSCVSLQVAWNPTNDENACIKPTGSTTVAGEVYCHFKILNADGSCIRLNRMLYPPVGTGVYDFHFSVPAAKILVTDSFYFPPSSDFDKAISQGYYVKDAFMLTRGDSFRFQISTQQEPCQPGGWTDGEEVQYTATVYIPHCCKGKTGDVDGNGRLDMLDVLYLSDYINRDGPEPPCMEEADVDGSGDVNALDLLYLADYCLRDGPAPLPCP